MTCRKEGRHEYNSTQWRRNEGDHDFAPVWQRRRRDRARLAKRLNWHLIDHELVVRVARELGIPEQQAEVQDEYAKGFIARVVSQFVSTVPTGASQVVQVALPDQTNQDRYQETLRRVVETAADTGRAVIIGRASQIFLAKRRDVLHVFIEAPLQERIAYVALRENLDAVRARERIQLEGRRPLTLLSDGASPGRGRSDALRSSHQYGCALAGPGGRSDRPGPGRQSPNALAATRGVRTGTRTGSLSRPTC